MLTDILTLLIMVLMWALYAAVIAWRREKIRCEGWKFAAEAEAERIALIDRTRAKS